MMQMFDGFIIAGGGIGGLATALALQKNGFSCRIYERDLHFNSRRQGYSLTVQKNGFEALQDLGVGDKVRSIGNESRIVGISTYDHFGQILSSKQKSSASNNRYMNFAIPRQRLREVLMNALADDTIQWNNAVLRYESIANDPHHVRIFLSDGTSIVSRALIGCDGVHSSIRKQMLADDLHYLGVWAINGIASHHNHERLANQTVQILDGQARLFIKPFDGEKSMWQLTFKVSSDDELYRQLDPHDPEGLLNRVKLITKNWQEPIPTLINDTPVSDIRAGPVFDRDPLERITKDVPCVTMLGDAVHPMSPFKGQGANQALTDAVNLVKCLIKHGIRENGMADALTEFETEMLQRSRKYVLGSRQRVQFLHTEEALSPR